MPLFSGKAPLIRRLRFPVSLTSVQLATFTRDHPMNGQNRLTVHPLVPNPSTGQTHDLTHQCPHPKQQSLQTRSFFFVTVIFLLSLLLTPVWLLQVSFVYLLFPFFYLVLRPNPRLFEGAEERKENHIRLQVARVLLMFVQ